MKLDYEKYRHNLARLELSREDENEILEYLWHMMSAQVDRAFGIDPVQLSQNRAEKTNLQSPDLIVDKKSRG